MATMTLTPSQIVMVRAVNTKVVREIQKRSSTTDSWGSSSYSTLSSSWSDASTNFSGNSLAYAVNYHTQQFGSWIASGNFTRYRDKTEKHYKHIALVQFDTSAIPSTITSASLRLYASGGGSTVAFPAIKQITASWSASSVTWNTKPDMVAGVSSISLGLNSWVSADVKSMLGTYGFAITDETDHSGSDWGKEIARTGTYAPQLVITYPVYYTITYNANGGTGAPSSQTKKDGENITLSSAVPTRTGYKFNGWAKSSTATTRDYPPGGVYGTDASVTLYAVWTANTYSVTYDANGGTGAPAEQTKTYGQDLTLSSAVPTRTDYNFKGWGTSASATTVSYSPGQTYTSNAAVTLYAIWELAYIYPTITNFRAYRCDSSGNEDAYETYVRVIFEWACDQSKGENPVSEITLYYNTTTDYATSKTSVPVTASGNSGTVDQIIGGGAISSDLSYTVGIEIVDTIGGESKASTATTTIPSAKFAIDFLAGGNGVAIGKPATKEGVFDVGMIQYDKYGTLVGNGVAVSKSDAIDPDTTLEHVIITNHSSCPASGYWYIQTFYENRKSDDASSRIQVAYPIASSTSVYIRYKQSTNAWTAWAKLAIDDGTLLKSDALSEYAKTSDLSSYVKDDGSDGFDKALYARNTVNTISYYRFHTGWIGFYSNVDNAVANTNRQGWMGFNAGTALNFVNSAASKEISFWLKYLDDYGYGFLAPSPDDTLYLGGASNRWKQVYAKTSSISTSDRNQKKDFANLDERYEGLFFDLKPTLYRFKENESNRIHTGFIAQDVEESLGDHNLTPLDFAAFCKDKAQEIVTDENGQDSMVDKLDQNGDPLYTYSLRYEELIALNTHMLQKAYAKIEEQQAQIDSLQSQINELRGLITNQQEE